MKTASTVLAASLVAGLVVACGAEQKGAGTAQNPVPGSEPPQGVTSAQNAVDQKTVERIADARCDHEQKCNNIGQGQKYGSRDDCKKDMTSSTSGELNATSCPKGLDQDALNRCLGAINNETCSAVSLDMLARIADCRTGSICMK
jgi:hypothetical protein